MSNIYYKVLNKDMESPYQQFHYELNKTYTTDEELDSYKSGFHACKNMYETIFWTGYRLIEECRFFKCTLGDKVIEDDYNVVSNSITLTEEIPFEIVDKDIRDNIDILINEKEYSLDYKIMMINQGYGLDILVNDEDEDIREVVAKHGYGLDILVHDESFFVRTAVARQGYGLDILIKDKNAYVRATVARQGYGLDKLIKDKNKYVKDTAKSKLKELERDKDNG